MEYSSAGGRLVLGSPGGQHAPPFMATACGHNPGQLPGHVGRLDQCELVSTLVGSPQIIFQGNKTTQDIFMTINIIKEEGRQKSWYLKRNMCQILL